MSYSSINRLIIIFLAVIVGCGSKKTPVNTKLNALLGQYYFFYPDSQNRFLGIFNLYQTNKKPFIYKVTHKEISKHEYLTLAKETQGPIVYHEDFIDLGVFINISNLIYHQQYPERCIFKFDEVQCKGPMNKKYASGIVDSYYIDFSKSRIEVNERAINLRRLEVDVNYPSYYRISDNENGIDYELTYLNIAFLHVSKNKVVLMGPEMVRTKDDEVQTLRSVFIGRNKVRFEDGREYTFVLNKASNEMELAGNGLSLSGSFSVELAKDVDEKSQWILNFLKTKLVERDSTAS
jgi:hypothetical protein